jgi:hypothetical protein
VFFHTCFQSFIFVDIQAHTNAIENSRQKVIARSSIQKCTLLELISAELRGGGLEGSEGIRKRE